MHYWLVCFLGPGERVDVVTLAGEKEAWRAEPRAERDLQKQRYYTIKITGGLFNISIVSLRKLLT